MIINKNISPERSLYYLGGSLIEVLRDNNSEEYDYLDLYEKFKVKNNISINLYSLTLDWLFIIGVISKGGNGRIKKCF
jgi:hypothetical protein